MSIGHILNLEMAGFLYALIAIIVFQLLTGGIRTKGLLLSKDGSETVSPARVQLLLATLAAGARYLAQVGSLPGNKLDVDSSWLYLMGGSSGIYALRKLWILFSNRQQGG